MVLYNKYYFLLKLAFSVTADSLVSRVSDLNVPSILWLCQPWSFQSPIYQQVRKWERIKPVHGSYGPEVSKFLSRFHWQELIPLTILICKGVWEMYSSCVPRRKMKRLSLLWLYSPYYDRNERKAVRWWKVPFESFISSSHLYLQNL